MKQPYNGEKTAGTEINGSSDIKVIGYYDDGSTAGIDLGNCIFKNPGKLESGVVSTFELEYEGLSAEIYITGEKAPYTVLKMGSYLNKLKNGIRQQVILFAAKVTAEAEYIPIQAVQTIIMQF